MLNSGASFCPFNQSVKPKNSDTYLTIQKASCHLVSCNICPKKDTNSPLFQFGLNSYVENINKLGRVASHHKWKRWVVWYFQTHTPPDCQMRTGKADHLGATWGGIWTDDNGALERGRLTEWYKHTGLWWWTISVFLYSEWIKWLDLF